MLLVEQLFTSAEMEMQMMDKEAEKGFRPRAGSTSSLVSLDASMRGLQIDSIIRSVARVMLPMLLFGV